MNVLVLGHRGMLGHVVARYLRERGHTILEARERYSGRLDLNAAEAIVNCAGVVRADMDGLYLTNALLPLHLAARLGGRLLVQPSTDCVFDGKRGWYRAFEKPDATDDYGLSKRLGEGCLAFPNVVVLRTSIVGPGGRGLLGWFLRQSGPVDGWTDHAWNGITTLAWAELAAQALSGDLVSGLYQPTTKATITKCELLGLFGEVFEHRIEVRPVAVGALDRTLAPTLPMPPLRDQLVALRDWA